MHLPSESLFLVVILILISGLGDSYQFNKLWGAIKWNDEGICIGARSLKLLGQKRGRSPQFSKKVDSPKYEIMKGKVTRLLFDHLTDIVCNGEVKATTMPDSFLLSSVSIDDIELNADFSLADIFISCYGTAIERREVYVWLCHNAKQIQHRLNQRLRFLRRVPQIIFQLVDAQEEAFMEQAFEEISLETQPEQPVWEEIEFEEAEEEEVGGTR